MPYFLANEPVVLGRLFQLSGPEAAHLALSRRAKSGERFFVQDPSGRRFEVELISVSAKTITFRPLSEITVPPEPAVSVSLFLSLIAEQALDIVLQKATELGASEIVIFNTANTATKFSSGRFKNKLPRWERICLEAAKQSDRVQPARVVCLQNLTEACVYAEKLPVCVLLDPSGPKRLAVSAPVNSIGLFVGPEGGFTATEVGQLRQLPQATLLSLGPRLLRADTAAIAGVALLNYALL